VDLHPQAADDVGGRPGAEVDLLSPGARVRNEHLQAGMAVLALRTAMEEYAWQSDGSSPRKGAEVLQEALSIVAEGFDGDGSLAP
jgi:hypothetical protein